MIKCGKAGCACAAYPDKRHGPYFELTYKANGKTVNLKLSPEAAPLYKGASLQYRKLKTLLSRLGKLSQIILRQQAKLTQSQPYAGYDAPEGQRSDVVSMIIAGLQEQLGLKLESRKAPVDILVVDHIEKPSQN